MKKFFAVLLGLSVILGISISAMALQNEEANTENVKNIVSDTVTYINPVYANVIGEDDFADLLSKNALEVSVNAVDEYIYSIEEAGESMREQLKAKTNPVVIKYAAKKYDKSLFGEIYGIAVEHTGEPDEGAYIQYNNLGYSGKVSWGVSGGYYYMTFSYEMIYVTTAEQEAEVDAAIEAVLAELDIEEESQYEKICAIYDYICENVEYDYENLYDEDYLLKYSTYAALINKTSVCQGYATLFYRLALECDIDNMVITGYSTKTGEGHAWNIVLLGDEYYNIDATWDAGRSKYDYFLKCDKNFKYHQRDDEFLTEEFYAEYEMADADYVHSAAEKVIASGWCGKGKDGRNLAWHLYSDGTIEITGSGEMRNYSKRHLAPWHGYVSEIESISLSHDMTSIGAYAFAGCKNLSGDLEISSEIKSIGENAFSGCGINDYYFEGDAPEIAASAFDSDSDTLHYNAEASGWDVDENGNLNGIHAEPITDDIASGFCGAENGGKNLSWVIDKEGVLTVSGEGKMADWIEETQVPWYAYKAQIKALVLEEGITHIGDYAFSGCDSITGELVLPESLEWIGWYAFQKCTGFTGDIVIPENVTTLGEWAFHKCTGFDGNLIIKGNITRIGNQAFYNCTGLNGSVTVPASVKTLGDWAFYNCGINEYHFEGNAPSVYAASDKFPSFDVYEDIIYFLEGTEGWELDDDGKWNGFNVVAPEVPDATVLFGDINGDGKINIIDANFARRYAAKLITFDESQFKAADVNGDGKVNIVDANFIRRYVAKLITSFPVEG